MRPSPILGRALRRLPLTTKQAGKDYYKGNRTGAMGWHTKHGGYVIDWSRVRTYVCPDLTDFKLSPFVDRAIEIKRDDMAGRGPEGAHLIKMWKQDGGRA